MSHPVKAKRSEIEAHSTDDRASIKGNICQKPIFGKSQYLAKANIWKKKKIYMAKTNIGQKPIFSKSQYLARANIFAKANIWKNPIFGKSQYLAKCCTTMYSRQGPIRIQGFM
jgi:predicted fused transcriptional regulator/phosphomethylpyrimidine kinase